MEVTLESVLKNKEIYNENLKKILQERAEKMKQVTELRRRKATLTDDIAIAEEDFKEAELVQQIGDLTNSYKGNKLTLEQLDLQQNGLEQKIDKESYAKGMVENRKAKANLSVEQELIYCENQVEKCEKALRLYTLMGNKEDIDKWTKALETAQKDLKYAQMDMGKEKSQSSSAEEKKDETDTMKKEEQGQEGYTFQENGDKYVEQQQQVLKDYSGKEIGNRTITWNTDKENGTENIETIGTLENEDGKYSMKEVSKTMGGELQLQRKELSKDNKRTGDREQLVYQKDAKGNEMYYKTSNGQIAFRITKNARGTTIDNYNNGQLVGTFEYDEDGKAIEGMGLEGMDQLSEEYVEEFFDSQVPYFEAENRELPSQVTSKENENENMLDSAIEATEGMTRTSTINEQVQNLNNVQRDRTNQQTKTNDSMSR